MIGLKDILIDIPNVKIHKSCSVICIRTANLTYLIFGEDANCPNYVLQFGDENDLGKNFQLLIDLHQVLPEQIAEPIALKTLSNGTTMSVQGGLAGVPWFNLKIHIQSDRQWSALKDKAISALDNFHSAIRQQPQWIQNINFAENYLSTARNYEHAMGGISNDLERLISTHYNVLLELDHANCFFQHGDFCVNNLLEYSRYKPPTTIKPPHKNSLNQAIFISESAAMTCPQTV